MADIFRLSGGARQHHPGDTRQGDDHTGDLDEVERLPEEDPGNGRAEDRGQAEQQQAETRSNLFISLEEEGVPQG